MSTLLSILCMWAAWRSTGTKTVWSSAAAIIFLTLYGTHVTNKLYVTNIGSTSEYFGAPKAGWRAVEQIVLNLRLTRV